MKQTSLFSDEVGKGPIGEALLQRYSRPVKYINKRCLAIAGAGMLFLGLSGSMQATPFSMSYHLDRGISSFNSHSNHQNFGDQHSFLQSDGRQSFYRPADTRQNYIMPAAEVLQEHAVMCSLPRSVTEPNGTSNVPDGGVTAVMVGAAMIGVVFMRKKQAA